MTTRLIAPDDSCHGSFLEAMSEFHAENRWTDLREDVLQQLSAFQGHVEGLRRLAERDRGDRPATWVPATVLWWVTNETFLGQVQIRHLLTERLRDLGGHIGFEVRPSARRRGNATRMLAAALPVAKGLGIDPALITCGTRNLASRKVIEHSGGELASANGTTLRFWVPTGP